MWTALPYTGRAGEPVGDVEGEAGHRLGLGHAAGAVFAAGHVPLIRADHADAVDLQLQIVSPNMVDIGQYLKERLEQSRKECANQSKAQPHREKPAPER
mgnify:CR=1 FL=1